MPSLDQVGTVVASSPGEIAIDVCPPNADCAASVQRFTMATKDGPIDLAIPIGTFVRVRLDVTIAGYEQPPFTALGLTLLNAPTFGGVGNPIEVGERLWATVSSGNLHDPVTVEQGETVCQSPNYDWTRVDLRVGVAGSAVDVEEGQTARVTVLSGPHEGTYRVRDLQSHADQIEGAFPNSVLVTRE